MAPGSIAASEDPSIIDWFTGHRPLPGGLLVDPRRETSSLKRQERTRSPGKSVQG